MKKEIFAFIAFNFVCLSSFAQVTSTKKTMSTEAQQTVVPQEIAPSEKVEPTNATLNSGAKKMESKEIPVEKKPQTNSERLPATTSSKKQ